MLLFICISCLFTQFFTSSLQVGSVEASLQVTPAATQLVGTIDSSLSLICSSSSKPILCLWKTPYGHVYTLSKGVFAESGRLRHKDDAEGDECGLEIVGLEAQDNGQWECEVGSLIGDTFQTASANINLNVKSKCQSVNFLLIASKSHQRRSKWA